MQQKRPRTLNMLNDYKGHYTQTEHLTSDDEAHPTGHLHLGVS